MKFTKMTESQWYTIQKHLPKPAKTGRPRCDDRATIDAIMLFSIIINHWLQMYWRVLG